MQKCAASIITEEVNFTRCDEGSLGESAPNWETKNGIANRQNEERDWEAGFVEWLGSCKTVRWTSEKREGWSRAKTEDGLELKVSI